MNDEERGTALFGQDFGQPLAARMRPKTLDEIAGQQHLIGPGKVLRRIIEQDAVSSMIFWGPPGVGKTTLAGVIAAGTRSAFINFSAVTSGIKEIRAVMQRAEENRNFGAREGEHHTHRRHHREPLVRGKRGSSVQMQGVRAEGALARGHYIAS